MFFPEFWAPLSQFQFSITENHGMQRIVPGMEKFLLLYFSASHLRFRVLCMTFFLLCEQKINLEDLTDEIDLLNPAR